MIDDILDITQSTEVLGKTAAKDLASNKTTYPKLLGLEKSKEVSHATTATLLSWLNATLLNPMTCALCWGGTPS